MKSALVKAFAYNWLHKHRKSKLRGARNAAQMALNTDREVAQGGSEDDVRQEELYRVEKLERDMAAESKRLQLARLAMLKHMHHKEGLSLLSVS